MMFETLVTRGWGIRPKDQRAGGGRDVRDAIVDCAVDIASVPIAQELESTSKSIRGASTGD